MTICDHFCSRQIQCTIIAPNFEILLAVLCNVWYRNSAVSFILIRCAK